MIGAFLSLKVHRTILPPIEANVDVSPVKISKVFFLEHEQSYYSKNKIGIFRIYALIVTYNLVTYYFHLKKKVL